MVLIWWDVSGYLWLGPIGLLPVCVVLGDFFVAGTGGFCCGPVELHCLDLVFMTFLDGFG